MYNKSSKNIFVLIIFMFSGLVVGGFIGKLLENVKYLNFLNYGKTFGISSPLILDLDIINLQFGLTFRFTIAGILCMIIAVFIYKRF